MNTARILAIIDKRTEEMKAEVLAEIEREPGAAGDSKWSTPGEYAAFARVNKETVRRWIMEGMPATDTKKDGDGRVIGTKRTTRIDREAADAWRASR